MSAINVTLKSQESSTTADDKGGSKLSGTRVYHVEVELGDDSETARTAQGIPTIGTPFTGLSPCKATSIQSRNIDEDQSTYEVTVSYSEKDKDNTTPEQGTNPLDEPAKYSWGGGNVSQKFFRDESDKPADWDEQTQGPWTGKPVVNSAGDEFQSSPEREVSTGSITITRNEAIFSDWEAEQYRNTTNANQIKIGDTTYSANQLRMDSITGQGPNQVTIPDPSDSSKTITVTYYSVNYTLTKNVKGWDLDLEDRGLNELSAKPGKASDGSSTTFAQPKPILGRDNQPVKTPYPLDGKGHAKPEVTDQPAVLKFKPYKAKNWADLNLGTQQ